MALGGSGGSSARTRCASTSRCGHATKIDSLDIYWPTTKKSQTFKDVPLDRYVRSSEGLGQAEIHVLTPVKLGGNKQ